MVRYGPLWQFPARKTAAGTDCGTQPARGAGTAGVGQSVGLWLGILPRGRRGPAVPGFFPADRYPAPVPGYACGRASGCSRPIRRAGVSPAPGEPAPPADRNTQSQYAAGQVSGVSGASALGRAGQYFTDAEIRDLYCPYNPVEKDFIVLGICTKGGTSPGDDLPDLYDAAGVEMRCHSCGNPLTGDNLCRDHQPPTNLRKQFFLFQSYNGNPPGETGKIRQILDYVCTHPLPLYEFECIIIKDGGAKRLRCQTSHLETARKLALGPIRTVNYGENFKRQYLYPHCCACSNTQGKKLW